MPVSLVRDLMTVGVPTCKWDTPVADIASFLLEQNTEGMCVLDQDGNGLGVVSMEELVTAYSREGARHLTAEEIMREGMPIINPEVPLIVGVQIMRDQSTRIAYIIHNSAGTIYPAAYITYRHIIRHLEAEDDQELKDLGISAERKSPLEVFIERRDAALRRAHGNKTKP